MLSFTKQIADRRGALMELNREARALRALLVASWDDPDYRAKRPVLWERVDNYLKRTKRHEIDI